MIILVLIDDAAFLLLYIRKTRIYVISCPGVRPGYISFSILPAGRILQAGISGENGNWVSSERRKYGVFGRFNYGFASLSFL